MKIAQIAPLWSDVPPQTYGGVELLVALLSRELTVRGHEVTLYASGASSLAVRSIKSVHARNLFELTCEDKAWTYEYYMAALVARAVQDASDFDVMHFHVGAQWIPFTESLATPSLFTFHTQLGVDDDWILHRYPRQRVNGVTHSQMAAVGTAYPVVHSGIDFDAYSPRHEHGSYLAFLGRMSAFKNPLDAIAAAARLDMPILLAGAPGDELETAYFDQHIKPLIDGCRVVYLGALGHAEKNDFLGKAGALLFPIAWEEPFGLVMVEAMACGTPVVAYGRGSVPEIVDSGVTGLVGHGVDDLVDLIPRALQLDRAAVRERAERRFDYRRMVDDYVAVYRELAGRAD
jgi:glycosyltransferase involved in cell wall biosynthesis